MKNTKPVDCDVILIGGGIMSATLGIHTRCWG
jgi:L-2-hydroxyglutarate oxidase LhgO